MRAESLSVILTLHNDSQHVPAVLTELGRTLNSVEGVELIIVDDASRDASVRHVEDHLDLFTNARLIRLPWHCGTGTAIRAGVAEASGRAIVFVDRGHPVELQRLTSYVRLLDKAEVLLTHRPAAAVGTEQSLMQSLRMTVYDHYAQRLTKGPISGGRRRIAAIRTEVAKPFFSLTRPAGCFFDAQTTIVAQSMGLRILELPDVRSPESAQLGVPHLPPSDLRAMVTDLMRAWRHRKMNGHLGQANASPSGLDDYRSPWAPEHGRGRVINLADAQTAGFEVAPPYLPRAGA